MAQDQPRATMAALAASLPDSVTCWLQPKRATRFTDEEAIIEFLAWEMVPMAPRPENRDLSQALALTLTTLEPARSTQIIGLLGELRLKTRTRHGSPDDALAQVGLYARDLEQWPADVVRHVLGQWPVTCDFWPTWRELAEACDRACKKRRALAEFLRANLETA